MVELTTVSEAIGKFAEALVEKLKKGEKLSSEDYLFLTLYYLSREIDVIDKRIEKSKEEIKDYIDKRIEDTNRRIDDLRAYVDKRFDDLKSDIKEINNNIRMILEILTKK